MLSAMLARLVCVAAVGVVLWGPRSAYVEAAGSHELSAGIVGLLVVAVLTLVPLVAGIDGGKKSGQGIGRVPADGVVAHSSAEGAHERTSGGEQGQPHPATWVGTPAVLLVGAGAVVALTGGWDSPLAFLYTLPAIALETDVGTVAVVALVASTWMVAEGAGWACAAPQWTLSRVGVAVMLPVTWAGLGALICALRVLLAERWVAGHRLRTAEATWRREVVALERSRSDLLAHVSHELLTPLAAVQAGAGLLADAPLAARRQLDTGGKWDTAAAHRIARNIQRNTTRLTLLVEDLLELARLDEATPVLQAEWHACATTMRRAVEAVALLFQGRGQRLIWDVAPVRLAYWGDARRVEQVLLNLLANAHKYAGEGATIRLAAWAEDAGVLMQVRDDGPGLGEQVLTRAFDRSFRAPGVSGQGYGLGLAIAEALVQLHGGSIWAENNPGPGCRFVFWLPYPHEGMRSDVAAPRGATGGGQMVKGVDDEGVGGG